MTRQLLAVPLAMALHAASPTFPAGQVAVDVARMKSQPTLLEWQAAFPHERVDRAPSLGPAPAEYGIDSVTQDRLCAASVEREGQFLRAAMFYQPQPAQGALPPLPDKQDASLIYQCKLQALWYNLPDHIERADAAQQMTAFWGRSSPTRDTAAITGAFWLVRDSWRLGDRDAWVALPEDSEHTIIYARITAPRSFEFTSPSIDVTRNAAAIAGLDDRLTTGILWRAKPIRYDPQQQAEDAAKLAAPLARWLNAARDLPPERKAAALLLADLYVTSNNGWGAPDTIKQYRRLGASFVDSFGYLTYSRNFLDQACKLSPGSQACRLARLSRWNLCTPDENGEQLLADFPPDKYTPYIYYRIAADHEFNLSLALARVPRGWTDPCVEAADPRHCKETVHSLELRKQDREMAIRYFRKYIDAAHDTREAVYAWQECWRLLASLPPVNTESCID
jgi:hypothetical protein